jgi:hypothetical protein
MMVCSGVDCPLRHTCKRFDPVNAAFNTKPQFSRPPFIRIEKLLVECDKYIDANNTYYKTVEKMKNV